MTDSPGRARVNSSPIQRMSNLSAGQRDQVILPRPRANFDDKRIMNPRT
ncbi:MAG TPA: hypothetical protein VG013_25280 [Gemmataceae bacterium]|nr:hypothetical protein [Gemmataceae bacterium]